MHHLDAPPMVLKTLKPSDFIGVGKHPDHERVTAVLTPRTFEVFVMRIQFHHVFTRARRVTAAARSHRAWIRAALRTRTTA